MTQNGAIVTVEQNPALISSEELERYRLDVRKMELQVKRKEAELRRVQEEQALLKELHDFNKLFITKIQSRAKATDANAHLKIAPESLEELMQLEDAQKLEMTRNTQLLNDAEILTKKRETLEQSITDQNCLINKIKENTGITGSISLDVNLSSVDNEYIDKKRNLEKLRDEEAMIKQHTERLTKEIDLLTQKIDENKDIEEKISEAENALRQLKEKHVELEKKILSCEQINKKKELELSKNDSTDPYKKVRQLDSDKKVMISDITSLRKTRQENALTIKYLQENILSINTHLDSINAFLHTFFQNVKENGEMDNISSSAEQVSLSEFEDLSHELNALRNISKYRDVELENNDASLERLEEKLLILRNAIYSLDKESKLQISKKDKEFQMHNEFADDVCHDYELQRQNILKEIKVMRHQLSIK